MLSPIVTITTTKALFPKQEVGPCILLLGHRWVRLGQGDLIVRQGEVMVR